MSQAECFSITSFQNRRHSEAWNTLYNANLKLRNAVYFHPPIKLLLLHCSSQSGSGLVLTDYPACCRDSNVLHLAQLYFHFKDVALEDLFSVSMLWGASCCGVTRLTRESHHFRLWLPHRSNTFPLLQSFACLYTHANGAMWFCRLYVAWVFRKTVYSAKRCAVVQRWRGLYGLLRT